jgi:hypothetical protein
MPKRYLDSVVSITTGKNYSIAIKVWGTKSVGILTTGDRTTGIKGSGSLTVILARAYGLFGDVPSAEGTSRGAISFQLIN